MRAAAIREMYLNSEVQKPSLEEILEFNPPPPNGPEWSARWNRHLIRTLRLLDLHVIDAEDIRARRALAREPLGVEIPLRLAGACSSPSNPWPKERSQRLEILRLPYRRGRCNGSGKDKETAGINMMIPPQQLLLQHWLKRVEPMAPIRDEQYSSNIISGACLPTTIVPGSTKMMSLQSGMDQSGLLRLQGI